MIECFMWDYSWSFLLEWRHIAFRNVSDKSKTSINSLHLIELRHAHKPFCSSASLLNHSFTYSLTLFPIPSHSHPLTYILSFTPSHLHPLTHPLTHLLTHPLTHPLTHTYSHPLTHTLLLTLSLTPSHSPSHSLTR